MLLLVLGHIATAIVAWGITSLIVATRMAQLQLENEVLRSWVDEHGGFTDEDGGDGD